MRPSGEIAALMIAIKMGTSYRTCAPLWLQRQGGTRAIWRADAEERSIGAPWEEKLCLPPAFRSPAFRRYERVRPPAGKANGLTKNRGERFGAAYASERAKPFFISELAENSTLSSRSSVNSRALSENCWLHSARKAQGRPENRRQRHGQTVQADGVLPRPCAADSVPHG